MTAPAPAGALAHVCMHSTGCLRRSALALCSNGKRTLAANCTAGLDLSHDRPAGRMRYDEGTGTILFAEGQQVQAYSTTPSGTARQPLWVLQHHHVLCYRWLQICRCNERSCHDRGALQGNCTV